MKTPEIYLRQFIKESILLESTKIDEATAHMIAAITARKRREAEEKSRREEEARRSAKRKERFKRKPASLSRPSSYSSEKTSYELSIENMRNVDRTIKYISYAVFEYKKHLINSWKNYESPPFTDWKEWLYHHIEDRKVRFPKTINIIKKIKDKYMIDENIIGDPADGKFELEDIESLKKKYENYLDDAREDIRVGLHKR